MIAKIRILKVRNSDVKDKIFDSIKERFLNNYHPRNFVREGIANKCAISSRLR